MSTSAQSSPIKFHCSACSQKLSVPAGLEGQKFACPNCDAPGHVPGAPPTEARVNGEQVIKFFCLHCGQKLSFVARAPMSVIRCPLCREQTPVPAAGAHRASEPRHELPEAGPAVNGANHGGGGSVPDAGPGSTREDIVASLRDLGFDVERRSTSAEGDEGTAGS